MIEYLSALDERGFYAINNGLSNPILDIIMPLLRNKNNWIPLYIFIVFYLIKTYKASGLVLIAAILIVFGISDYTSSKIVKPAFARIRPCNDPKMTHVNLLIDCGSGKSFTSSHATNHFAIAVFMILFFYKRFHWILPTGLIWAASISIAQVYVGVHYPFDILGGALLGTIIATTVYFLLIKFFPRFN